ncbi:Uncharacterized conserved protein, circularly permuted ATPgrasp superfamily [Williamsia sterculiae]|uniref:Uncharacterized conserved protein, circularly permuted ATPgrasp superfamily n=1 Tax=Williamsia sterculiae TaxID=1344003 RepID=A0A1N7EHG3_9NOCA|nr:Uncharacterized conserved protein, circularly permuted ATPgrasp superfamily [Williamsia sterculiae]
MRLGDRADRDDRSLDTYRAQRSGDAPGTGDEMLEPDGEIRSVWADLIGTFARTGDSGLRQATQRVAATVRDDGITYNAHTAADTTQTRSWVLDSIPLAIDGAEWAGLERGLAQRALLLDALLTDIYGEQRTIATGLLPPELVYGHPGYLRKAARLPTPGPHALFLHAADIGRTASGEFVVYADRTQAPSGIGYAIADRRVLSRAFPRMFGRFGPRPIAGFIAALRSALIGCAPDDVTEPTVAVLSPGSLSETAFDQAHLASVLGFPLVEAADLVVRDGGLYMRSLGRFKRVDVLLRRVDAPWVDPLDLRSDSRLGVAGLVEIIARGQVGVVNTLGSGVLENPALHTLLPRLAPALIDEDLLMGSVSTWWAGDPTQRTVIRDDAASLVLTNFHTGEEFVGPLQSARRIDELRARVEAETWQWTARGMEHYSVAPSVVPGGSGAQLLRPAPVGLRSFAVAQTGGYAVMPGGLGQVLADGPLGAAMVSVAGKDVWVSSESSAPTRITDTQSTPADAVEPSGGAESSWASPRVVSDLFWLGRYGERAEVANRLLKVVRERYEDYRFRPWMNGTRSMPLLLIAAATVTANPQLVADVDAATPPDDDDVSEALTVIAELTVARHVPGTVAHSTDRLTASARAVRDQLSTSTWMVLSSVDRALNTLRSVLHPESSSPRVGVPRADRGEASSDDAGPELDVVELGRAQSEVLNGLLALTGLQAESMVHDPGWLFMDMGRRLERGITLADLNRVVLDIRHDPDTEQALLEAYLVANESSVIYRRRNRGIIRPVAVLALLLFDETNPRSMIFQLTGIRGDLVGLPEEIRSAPAERIVEDLIAELRRVDPTDLVAVAGDGRRELLTELMTTIGDGLRELSTVLGRTRFAPPADLQPLWGGGLWGASGDEVG